MATIDRRTITVAVHDAPFAVLAAVDVRDAQDGRLHRPAVVGEFEVFETHGVGQITADPGGHEFDAERLALRHVRGEPTGLVLPPRQIETSVALSRVDGARDGDRSAPV